MGLRLKYFLSSAALSENSAAPLSVVRFCTSANITTTVRNKRILSTSPWLPAHALASLVAFPPAERFPTKNWQIEEASL